MSSVRKDFPKGSRVRVQSPAGWYCVPHTGHTATVVGYSRDEQAVRIVVDGLKTPYAFHKTFLEVWDE